VRTILAMGGGGFTAEPGDPALDELVLQLAGKPVPRILFLPTAIWSVHGLDRLLRDAWERGVVLAGLSAGAMCWFQGGITTSSGAPEPTSGLGLLPGSLSVHADAEPARRYVYLRAVQDGALPPGWLVDDGVGLLFRDMALERVVAARRGARAARVDLVDGQAVEKPIEPDLVAPAPRSAPADVRELRAVRYGVRRD
jgi:dipeptidase E